MSNRLVTLAWNARGLTPAQKIVLVRLADRADDKGHCFPGHQSIADDCGLTVRTVQDALREIETRKHITIKHDASRSMKGFSRFSYLVHPSTPEIASGVTPENGAVDTGKRALRHRKITASTPENGAVPNITIMNPQSNPQRTRFKTGRIENP